MEPSADQGDPFDWTVDQVIAYLCHSSPTAWSHSRAPTPHPDPTTFEKSLQENDVNGQILLVDITTKEILRDDLGVKSLGQRGTLWRAIELLRKNSFKYQQRLDQLRYENAQVQADTPRRLSVGYSPTAPHSDHHTHAHYEPWNPPTESRVQSPVLPLPAMSPYQMRPLDRRVQPDASTSLRNSDTDKTGEGLLRLGPKHTAEQDQPGLESPADNGIKPSEPASNSKGSYTIRPREHQVIDNHGRKRRRLELASSAAPTTPATPASPYTKRWYIGPRKVSATDVFYSRPPNDDDDFSFTKSAVPTGQRLVVKRLLNHYFRQQPYNLGMKDGKQLLGIIPYPGKSIPVGNPQYFTLFTPRNNKILVSKEMVQQWPQIRQASSSRDEMVGVTKVNDPYDQILQKYPDTDDIIDSLPPYGESSSEGEYDSDTLREMEAEQEMKTKALAQHDAKGKSKILSADEVNTTIENCLQTFAEKWDSTKLPAESRKAWRLWTLSRRFRNKKPQIAEAKQTIHHLEQRLKKIREAFLGDEWFKVQDLQGQCQSMEWTVFDIKKQKWRISTLELNECPPKLPREGGSRKRVKKPVELDLDGEESLNSDSEEGSDENMEDFIAADPEITETRPDDDMDVSPPPADNKTRHDSQQRGPEPLSDSEEDVGPISAKKWRSLRKSISPRETSLSQPSQPTIDRANGSGTPVPVSTSPYIARSSNSVQLLQQHEEDIEFIDLTQVNDSDADHAGEVIDENRDITTPPLNPVNPSKKGSVSGAKKHKNSQHKKSFSQSSVLLAEEGEEDYTPNFRHQAIKSPRLPLLSDFYGISILDYKILEERQDRRRLLIRLIMGIPDDERRDLCRFTAGASLTWFKKHAELALLCLLKPKQSQGYMVGALDAPQSTLMMRISALFIAWLNSKRLTAKGIKKEYITRTQKRMKEFEPFFDLMEKVFSEYSTFCDKRDGLATNRQEVKDDLDSDDLEKGIDSISTPHKKRKRVVKENQEAIHTQKSGQERVEFQRRQQKLLAMRMESMGVSNSDPARQAVCFGSPVIYLDPHIGRRVKQHQLNGIQFMWREIINDEKGAGCLLAHTMGLGKTMQVISLLVTIANAGASIDRQVRAQVPETLRKTRALIICPSSLIENWWEEFLMWTPPDPSTRRNLGPLRKIISQNTTVDERLGELSAWNREGGVLIVSYELFRAYVQNKGTKNRAPQLSEDVHERVRKQFLDGPTIIIADEAHKMKNRGTGVAIATAQFKSRSRIALTGSPLANNLIEYYSMIDWIAPGYLGEPVQFKAKFVEPIAEGLYADSTSYERRRSLKKLQVLKEDVSPKVNRADISVLQGSLPPKVEFVITVPLTDLQTRAYNMYTASLLSHDLGPKFSTRLMDWLSVLSLCCNHPYCFRDKLQERKDKLRPSSSEDSDREGLIDDVPVLDVSNTMVKKQIRLLNEASPELASLVHSYRAQIVDQIIDESIKVGDKVLVFSQSLPTLDFIEELLKAGGRRYSRLDGKTPAPSRQASTKEFNSTNSTLQVYLISTLAGGLGLNILGANRVIIFDFSFNPTHEEQAVGRAYRLGQQKSVYVYRFISGGTYQDIIYNKAVFKTQLSYRVVDKKNPIRWASKSPKDYLFPVKPIKQEDLSEFKGKDPNVLDKILARQNFIRSIGLTETFQREDNDKLTEEEERDVQEELNDERLKRNDPIAWEKKNAERTAREAAMLRHRPPGPYPPEFSPGNMDYPTTVPGYASGLPAYSSGPPAPAFVQAPRSQPAQTPGFSRSDVSGPPPQATGTSMHPGVQPVQIPGLSRSELGGPPPLPPGTSTHPGVQPVQSPGIGRPEVSGPPPLPPDTSMHPGAINAPKGPHQAVGKDIIAIREKEDKDESSRVATLKEFQANGDPSGVPSSQSQAEKSGTPSNQDGRKGNTAVRNGQVGSGMRTPRSADHENRDKQGKSTCATQ